MPRQATVALQEQSKQELPDFVTELWRADAETALTLSVDDLLTPRQLKEVQLASLGLTGVEAAKQQFYAVGTIKTHRRLAIQNLGAKTMAQTINILGINNKLNINEHEEPQVKLLPLEWFDLLLGAVGFTKEDMYRLPNRPSWMAIKTARAGVLRSFNAKNFPHAIRRAYDTRNLPLEI